MSLASVGMATVQDVEQLFLHNVYAAEWLFEPGTVSRCLRRYWLMWLTSFRSVATLVLKAFCERQELLNLLNHLEAGDVLVPEVHFEGLCNST